MNGLNMKPYEIVEDVKGTPRVSSIANSTAQEQMNAQAMDKQYQKGAQDMEINMKDSLANYLAQQEAAKIAEQRAQMVAEAKRADLLGRIQQDMQAGNPVPPEAMGLYNDSIVAGQQMPVVGPNGQPVYYNTKEY